VLGEDMVFDALLETLADLAGRDRSADVVRQHHHSCSSMRRRHKKGTQQAEVLGRSRGGSLPSSTPAAKRAASRSASSLHQPKHTTPKASAHSSG
jgi:hypothetical protein